jgi:hypothetical protein
VSLWYGVNDTLEALTLVSYITWASHFTATTLYQRFPATVQDCEAALLRGLCLQTKFGTMSLSASALGKVSRTGSSGSSGSMRTVLYSQKRYASNDPNAQKVAATAGVFYAHFHAP